MQKNISFEADILKGLAGNSDMLSSYVLAAIADHGQGVKVCWSLWPHLTPPAKVGGVTQALVKMGLLVPMPGGLYQVVTTKGATEDRSQGESGATSQQQTNEVSAKAPEYTQAKDSDEGETRAEQEQRASDDEATSQRQASDDEAGGDIEALESLLDGMTTKESVVHLEEITIEERARALACRAWEIMPQKIKDQYQLTEFEDYWQGSKSQHLRAAANA